MPIDIMPYPIENLQYLSLEGGGGRGILYVEPINVLEDAIRDEVFQSAKANDASIRAFHARVLQNLMVLDGENGGEGGTETGLEPPPEEIELPVINITGHFSLIQLSTPPYLRKIKGLSGSSAGAITAFMLSLGMSSEDIKSEMARTDIKAKNAPKYKGPISVFEQFVDEKPTNTYKQVVDGNPDVGKFINIVDTSATVLNLIGTLMNFVLVKKGVSYASGIFCPILRSTLEILGTPLPFSLTYSTLSSADNCRGFFGNLIGERGLFAGLGARTYFSSLIEKYLYPALESLEYPIPETPPGELTFRQFYDLTGVDLVLTGTNISRRSTLYFSVYHTPDFPVVEAVQISMTLPIAFKPVYVDTDVRAGDTAQKLKYQGLFIDGGMLNNYPIHAFDHIENTGKPTPDAGFLREITFHGLTGEYPIAGDPKLRQADCDCVLGMRLQDKEEKPMEIDKKKLYPSNEIVLGSFLKDLLATYMTYSEEGQIRSVSDEERSVEFYATVYKKNFHAFSDLVVKLGLEKDSEEYRLSVMDFSSPAIDRKRNLFALAQAKDGLMTDAKRTMEEFLKS